MAKVTVAMRIRFMGDGRPAHQVDKELGEYPFSARDVSARCLDGRNAFSIDYQRFATNANPFAGRQTDSRSSRRFHSYPSALAEKLKAAAPSLERLSNLGNVAHPLDFGPEMYACVKLITDAGPPPPRTREHWPRIQSVTKLSDSRMFRRTAAKSLRLGFGDQTRQFASLADFEYALAGRTGIPLSRLSTLLGQPNSTLLRDAEQIRRIALRLTHVVSSSSSESPNVSAFLIGFDLLLISEDYGWRAIFAALAEFDSSIDAFKRVALVKYGQYLTAREEATRAIFASRRSARRTPEGSANAKNRATDGLKETLIVDLYGELSNHDTGYDRLPKGEAVEINLSHYPTVPLMLVKHKCEIIAGDPPAFINAQGQLTKLRSYETAR